MTVRKIYIALIDYTISFDVLLKDCVRVSYPQYYQTYRIKMLRKLFNETRVMKKSLEVEFELFSCNDQERIAEISKKGYEVDSLAELMHLGSLYPNLQKCCSIIAPKSSFFRDDGRGLEIPVLFSYGVDGDERGLSFTNIGSLTDNTCILGFRRIKDLRNQKEN